MKNETAMPRPTISNLYSGQIVTAGYKRGRKEFLDSNRFVGFRVGENDFSNLKMVKQAYGVRNLKDLEFESDRFEETVYARFYNINGGFYWSAYLWESAFRIGTSADRLTFQ